MTSKISTVARCECRHLYGAHDGACGGSRGRGACGCQEFQRADNQPHLMTMLVLRTHIEKMGYAPSVRELADTLRVKSTATINQRLEVLEAAGLIERVGPRAIKLI